MSMSISSMSDTTKAMLFMFLGLMVAILILGFHKSPAASKALGAASLAARQPTRAQSAPNISVQETESYQEEENY